MDFLFPLCTKCSWPQIIGLLVSKTFNRLFRNTCLSTENPVELYDTTVILLILVSIAAMLRFLKHLAKNITKPEQYRVSKNSWMLFSFCLRPSWTSSDEISAFPAYWPYCRILKFLIVLMAHPDMRACHPTLLMTFLERDSKYCDL